MIEPRNNGYAQGAKSAGAIILTLAILSVLGYAIVLALLGAVSTSLNSADVNEIIESLNLDELLYTDLSEYEEYGIEEVDDINATLDELLSNTGAMFSSFMSFGMIVIVLMLGMSIITLLAGAFCIAFASKPEKMGIACGFSVFAAILQFLNGNIPLFVACVVGASQASKAKKFAAQTPNMAPFYVPVSPQPNAQPYAPQAAAQPYAPQAAAQPYAPQAAAPVAAAEPVEAEIIDDLKN